MECPAEARRMPRFSCGCETAGEPKTVVSDSRPHCPAILDEYSLAQSHLLSVRDRQRRPNHTTSRSSIPQCFMSRCRTEIRVVTHTNKFSCGGSLSPNHEVDHHGQIRACKTGGRQQKPRADRCTGGTRNVLKRPYPLRPLMGHQCGKAPVTPSSTDSPCPFEP